MKLVFSCSCVVLVILLILASCGKKTEINYTVSDSEQTVQIFEDYITVDEYNSYYPEHEKIMGSFSQLVKQPSRPIISGIQEKTVKIAVLFPGEQVSDYWLRSVSSFSKRMDELGIKYEIDEYFTRSGTLDIQKQEEYLRLILTKDFDYLVFTLNVMSHRKLIEQIIIKGAPKLILQNITTPLRIWEGKQPFLYVGFDHMTGSIILADYFIDKTGGKGNYAVLFYSEGYVSDMRGNTFIQYVKSHSELNLISSYYTDGLRERAKNAVSSILEKNQDIKFIYSCSTDVAFGAVDTLIETGNIGKIEVNGWGGGSSELNLLLKKQLDVTVMRINDDNGVAMAEAVKLELENRSEEIPLIYSGEMVLIRKDIILEELEVIEKRAFRYSNE